MRHVRPILPVLALLVVVGCAGNPSPHAIADGIDKGIITALQRLDNEELAAFQAGTLDPDPVRAGELHKRISAALVPAWEAARAMNTALTVWTPQSSVTAAQQARLVGGSAQVILSLLPEGSTKVTLQVYCQAVTEAVAAFLEALKGSQ